MSDVVAIQGFVTKYKELKSEIAKVIIGQDDVVNQILISIFSGGHALLIGVPGLAKTLMVNTIASALGLDFKRIQFTPDLMPSDILGSEILDENRQFKFIKGPIFANIILADEINRTPPKTQAALQFAQKVTSKRGQVSSDEIQTIKNAGYNDEDILEIVLNVVANTLTNYVNHIADTEVDFPSVEAGKFAVTQ